MTGLGFDLNPARIGQLLRNPSGVAELLVAGHPETGDSPAEIMADIVNIMRADTKQLADIHGVEVEMHRMTPDRAAELLAGTIGGEGIELVVMFNELAEQRDRILQEALPAEEYREFDQQRRAFMHTGPGEQE